MAGRALGLSHPRDLFLSLPQPRLPETDGGRREKAEMLTLRNRDDFGTTEIRLALTGLFQWLCTMPWEKGTLFLWGTGTFCLRASATTACFLALLTQTGGRGEEQRGPRGESDSSEEQKGTCLPGDWGSGMGGVADTLTKCFPFLTPVTQWGVEGLRDCTLFTQAHHNSLRLLGPQGAPRALCSVGLRQRRTGLGSSRRGSGG